jgi:hypothetical protein
MEEKKLQIAINKNNELVSIYDVLTGEKCNCICPECEAKLIAKNDNKTFNEPLKAGQKIAHFAHLSGADCPGAQETAIHLLAKKILSETKRLLIPPLRKNEVELSKSKTIIFDEVEIEKKVIKDKIEVKPDLILKKGEKQLFIEFYKTHAVEDSKIKKIEKLNISCIEINLNGIEPLKNGKLNVDDIKNLLEEDLISKHWIFNSQQNLLYIKYLENQKTKEEGSKNKLLEKERIENEKKIAVECVIFNLEEKGYNFLLIEKQIRHDFDTYYNENTGRTKTKKSINSKWETVDCPKMSRTVRLNFCENCYYYGGVYKTEDSHGTTVACGFENKLINKKT